MCIAVCAFHFKNAVFDREQRHIKCASTQIKNEHIDFAAALFLFQTIRNGRSRRLIDDAQHVQPSNRACILCRLALGICKNTT